MNNEVTEADDGVVAPAPEGFLDDLKQERLLAIIRSTVPPLWTS